MDKTVVNGLGTARYGLILRRNGATAYINFLEVLFDPFWTHFGPTSHPKPKNRT